MWTELQENQHTQCIFSVVDMHSITLKQVPSLLRQNTYEMLACMLACGVDPSKCILFKQSDVPEHSHLYWILSCFSTLNSLYRFPQYKEKSEGMKDIPVGFLAYPVLQAADILLYKATHVPVGEEQLPHINLCSHLANKFNLIIGNVFPIPKAMTASNKSAVRIRSLRKPDKKMSKSDTDERSRIELTDTSDMIREKFKKAMTDMRSEVTYEPNERQGVTNLILIHSLFTGLSPQAIVEDAKNLTTAEYKLVVADVVIESLKPMRDETLRLMNDIEYLDQVFERGREQATVIARDTINQVRELIGMKTENRRIDTMNELLNKEIIA